MKPADWLAAGLVLLSLALPGASATYEPGSQVEADAPVYLSGRTDALVSNEVATLLGGSASVPVLLSIQAEELALESWKVPPPCVPSAPTLPTGPSTFCGATEPEPETALLHGARVTLLRALSAYKVVVTNDPQYGKTSSFGATGAIVATNPASATLGAAAKPLHVSPCDDGWASEGQPECGNVPVYQVDALDASVTAAGGALRGTGGMQVLLQGVSVRVTGTDADGKPFDQTYETPVGGEETKFLVLETTNGNLHAGGAGDLAAYGVKTVDARGSATLARATGRIAEDGGEREYAGEDATLAGPLSLTITGTKQGAQGAAPRIAFAVSSTLRVADLAQDAPEKDSDPLQLAAAGAGGAAGAALLATLVYFWPRLKFAATLLFLPMYTRIERTAVLEHEKRDEIYELIRATPGIHAHEIGEKTNIGWGTTVYHLKMLEQHSLVVSKKSGRYKRFFVNTGEYTKKKDLYGALRNETAKAVADYIVNHPGCNQKELCAALGIQPSLASWHVEKLEGVELVKRVKDGRTVRYYAGAGWEQLNVRVNPIGGGADTPAET